MSSGPGHKLYVIAGEASGDLHGANLIGALKRLSPFPIEFFGVGGDRIKETGAKDFFDLAHFHVTGITQAVRKIPQYQKAGRVILKSVAARRPHAVVLVDNPGFNLYLAKRIHAMGIPVIYYISPQIWAWKRSRIFKIRRTVKKMLVVFEFEKKLYEEYGVPVAFVGHPLRDSIGGPRPVETPERWIALMPGSRRHEVSTLLPIMLGAAEKIGEKFPDVSFKLIKSPTLDREFYAKPLEASKAKVELVEDDSYGTIRKSLLALVCSGTATLECALLGTPMIITNRAGFLTYLAARALLRVPYLGLPNLILGRMAMPELLQYDATAEKFAEKAVRILSDGSLREKMKKDLAEISAKLGQGGAAENAAREILKTL